MPYDCVLASAGEPVVAVRSCPVTRSQGVIGFLSVYTIESTSEHSRGA